MLSDEEKEAIEELKNKKADYFMISNLMSKILLNLIEKQSKEIGELKQIKLKLQEKNIPIETLLAEFERLEDLEDDLTTVYLNGVYDGEKKVEDKIKAKIEEVLKQLERKMEEEYNKYGNSREYQDMVDAYNFLQSLLEKE